MRIRGAGKSWSVFIILAFFIQNAFSQDIHFSQSAACPIYLNPALSGFSNSDLRVNLNHRSQWRIVTKPYQTFAASIDAPLIKRKFQRDILSFGLVLISDKAGDSEFSTSQAELALGYIKALGSSNRFFLGVGLRGGYIQRTLNYEKLSFDKQYNGFFYDPDLPQGELFTQNRQSMFDFSAGLHLFYQIAQEENLMAGYALSHFTQPDISLMGDKSIRLPMKHAIYFSYEREWKQRIYLQPSVYYFLQENFMETLVGITLKQVKFSNPDAYQAYYYGIHTRAADAAVAYFGLDHRTMHFGFTYDINYSKLRKASYGAGGFEIAVSWLINRSKTSKIKAIPCPMF